MSILADKSILITGGTGSFGKHFVPFLLKKYPELARIVVFSRDEHKQYAMRSELQASRKVKFILGDVRDYESVYQAFKGVDFVIHAAALKHIHIAEENPFECIKTNILGSQNVLKAAKEHRVSKVIGISTDKASSPSSIYGASKLCADKLFLDANSQETRFTIVRYANVFGSAGSVVPLFLKKAKEGVIPVTHPEMTRFSITPLQASELVEFALLNSLGGEILVPKLPAFRILDLAESICPTCKIEYIGIRAGEKIHEEMISQNEALFTLETNSLYIVVARQEHIELYQKHYQANRISKNFYYSSQNQPFMSLEDLKQKLKDYQNEDFVKY